MEFILFGVIAILMNSFNQLVRVTYDPDLERQSFLWKGICGFENRL